jgi:phosphoserine phosphatase
MVKAVDSRIAAFFDLDRTLLDMNSSTLWAKHELRRRSISVRQFGRVLVWNVLYHLSLIDIETAFKEAVGHYRGRSYEGLDIETRDWFARDVAHHLRPGAGRALREHREKGHQLVLLTSASAFASRAARGAGKVERAQAWASVRGIDLGDCYFYTDSFSDAPMLKAVGYPRVVSPDPRLSRAARQRGWPILQW